MVGGENDMVVFVFNECELYGWDEMDLILFPSRHLPSQITTNFAGGEQ